MRDITLFFSFLTVYINKNLIELHNQNQGITKLKYYLIEVLFN
jgi:hypothetical protein